MTIYAFTVYHDEPENAATDATGTYGFKTRAAAARAAKAAMTDYWNGGATVERGIFEPGEFGVRPDSWTWQETIQYLASDGEPS
jgi:hypothetical protein